jgi:hypothetical protein
LRSGSILFIALVISGVMGSEAQSSPIRALSAVRLLPTHNDALALALLDLRSQPVGPPSPQAAPQSAAPATTWAMSAQKCTACHSGKNLQGNFDVTKYATYSPEQKMVVIQRLTTRDEGKRMPRTPEGKAGPVMGFAELRLWLGS